MKYQYIYLSQSLHLNKGNNGLRRWGSMYGRNEYIHYIMRIYKLVERDDLCFMFWIIYLGGWMDWGV